MSHAISDIGSAISNTVQDIGHAVSSPAGLLGSTLGFGIGGAGGLTGGNLAGNAITGQPLTTNLTGSLSGDLLGLGAGAGIAGLSAPAASAGAGGWATASDPYGLGLDQGNFMGGPGTIGASDFGGAAGAAGAGGFGGWGALAGAGANAAGHLLGGGATGGGNSLLGFLTGSNSGPTLPSLAPGLAALQYARQQTPIDTSQLQGVFNAAGANAPLLVQAAQDPLKQAQAGGYGDILQSQGLRGIRGSSFGDQSIASYLTDTNRGIADAGASAAQQALGLQGSLAGQISNLNALSQQMKNNLYGRAFSSLGQGLNPTPGMGMGIGGGAPGGGSVGAGGASSLGGMLGNLGLGGVGGAFGNVLGNIGSGLGNLFGSPGSTFWGSAPISGMPTDYLGDFAGF